MDEQNSNSNYKYENYETVNPDEICIKMMKNENNSATSMQMQSANSLECQQCDLQLKTLEEFINHMRLVHLHPNSSNESTTHSELTSCPICNVNLSPADQKMKNAHIREHFISTQNIWKCKKCKIKKTFSTLHELQQHFLKMHMNKIYRCTICLELFMEQDALLEHLFGHTNREQKFKCISCELEFENQNFFDLHIQQIHLSSNNFFKRPAENELTNGAPKNKMIKKESSKAEDLIGMKAQMQQSIQQQYSTKGLKCIVCDLKCPDEFTLDQHRLHAHCKIQKGNQCAICRDSLANVEEFIEHSRNHNKSMDDVNCVICRQSIRGELQMRMHGEYHLDIKEEEEINDGNEPKTDALLECLTCKMKVEEPSYGKHLLLHVIDEISDGREENGQQNCMSPCSQCGKLPKSVDEMNLHILEHLGELFGPSCSNGISNNKKQSIANREADCHEELVLPKNRFTPSTKRHQIGSRTLQCRICDKKFLSEDQMDAHNHAVV